MASNWKTLLLVDAGLAVVAIVAGVLLLLTGRVWGVVPLVLGLAYGFFVGGRAARWSRIRRSRGV